MGTAYAFIDLEVSPNTHRTNKTTVSHARMIYILYEKNRNIHQNSVSVLLLSSCSVLKIGELSKSRKITKTLSQSKMSFQNATPRIVGIDYKSR